MKIFVIHDDAGRIRGTLAASSDAENVSVRPLGGLRVYTTQAADVEGSEKRKFIHDLHSNHRVSMTAPEPTLMRVREESKAAARKK